MFDTPLIKRPAYSEGAHLRALKSLDLVEQIALPSVDDLSLLTKYIESSKALSVRANGNACFSLPGLNHRLAAGPFLDLAINDSASDDRRAKLLDDTEALLYCDHQFDRQFVISLS
jgi:hypothetical protein